MRNLMAAEFLRLVSRRLTIVVVVLTVAVAALQALVGVPRIMPLTEEDYAQARAAAVENQPYHDQFLRDCEAEPECDPADHPAPPPADFLRWVQDFDTFIDQQFLIGGVLLLFAVAVWVAIMVGADFRTGSLATQLMFTPQRIRLACAKVVSAVAVSVAFAVLATVVALGVSVTAFLMVREAAELVTPPGFPAVVGRLVVSALVVAAVVGLLTILTGSTVGTIVVVGGLMLASSIAQTSVIGINPVLAWLPTVHLEALFGGSYHHWLSYTGGGGGNAFVIGFYDALVYFAVMIAALAVAAGLRIQRRDLMI